MPSKYPQVYPREKPSIFILWLSVSFILIFGAACIVVYKAYRKEVRDTIRTNEAKANLLSRVILEHQRAAVGILRYYRNRPLLVEAAKKKDFDGAMIHLAGLVHENSEIQLSFITDPKGILWANFPFYQEAINQNLSYRDWYKGVSKDWNPYVSAVYKLFVGEKDLGVAICSPIRDERGRVIGILAGVQTTGFFKNIVNEVGLDAGEEIILLDQAGYIIYSNRIPYKKEVIAFSPFELVKKVIQGERGDAEIQDPSDKNRTKYLSFERIKGMGWSVIVAKSKSAVFQSEFLYLILIAAISLLVFIVIVLFLVYLRGRHKQITILRESENRLRILATQLLTAQEMERKRVAGELHDSIGSSLSVIKFSLEHTKSKMEQGVTDFDAIKHLITITEKTIEESRRIQTNLRPSMLDDLGILTTLDWHCREFQKAFSHIRIEKEIDISENDLPQSLKTVIYRICQEAMNNITKHSKASLIMLSLRKNNGLIELTIQDNGQGFDLKDVFSMESYRRGLGLSSMKERAELLGGSFTIESTRGNGTIIKVSLPIEQKSS